MLAQGSKLGFAAGSLLAPWGAAECLRLRNPITGRVGDADFVGSGTTYILNPDTGALFKVFLPSTPVQCPALNHQTLREGVVPGLKRCDSKSRRSLDCRRIQ